MKEKFIFMHKKRDSFVFWVCFLAAIALFMVNDARAEVKKPCTPGEKQTIIYKWANKQFYSEASRKGEKFLWTDWECEKLMNEVLKKAKKRANLICS